VALAFFIALVARSGSADGFHFYRTIHVGEFFANPQLMLPGQPARDIYGYDGQFDFFIAQDPFLRNPQIAPSLDNSLRYRRILYPLLAWMVTFGQRAGLPWALVLINVAAGTAAIAALAEGARRRGRSPWLALTAALYPGLWMPILMDLTEPLQFALLAWAIVLDGSAALLLLSALAKETTAAVQVIELIRRAWARQWARAGRHAVALALLAGWALLVWKTVHAHESTLGGHLLDPPGAPLIALASAPGWGRLLLVATAVGICVLAIFRLVWARDPAAWAGAVYAAVGLAAGIDTWADPLAYFRVIAGAVVLVFLSWTAARDRAGAAAMGLSVVAGIASLVLIPT
jgi:hypothetical protein